VPWQSEPIQESAKVGERHPDEKQSLHNEVHEIGFKAEHISNSRKYHVSSIDFPGIQFVMFAHAQY
jgi:hypothetical protein